MVVLRYDVALLTANDSAVLELRIQNKIVSPRLLPAYIGLQSPGMTMLAESLIESAGLRRIFVTDSFIYILLSQRSRDRIVLSRLRHVLVLALLRFLYLLDREVQTLQEDLAACFCSHFLVFQVCWFATSLLLTEVMGAMLTPGALIVRDLWLGFDLLLLRHRRPPLRFAPPAIPVLHYLGGILYAEVNAAVDDQLIFWSASAAPRRARLRLPITSAALPPGTISDRRLTTCISSVLSDVFREGRAIAGWVILAPSPDWRQLCSMIKPLDDSLLVPKDLLPNQVQVPLFSLLRLMDLCADDIIVRVNKYATVLSGGAVLRHRGLVDLVLSYALDGGLLLTLLFLQLSLPSLVVSDL